jgi:hypothetical protein
MENEDESPDEFNAPKTDENESDDDVDNWAEPISIDEVDNTSNDYYATAFKQWQRSQKVSPKKDN